MFCVKSISDQYNFNIIGASYIGAPKSNTAMYITKKVEPLLVHLNEVKECLVFAEDTISVPDTLAENNCFVLTSNPQAEYATFMLTFAEKIEMETRKKKYILTDGGYYIGENVFIGENAQIDPLCLIGHDVVIGKNAKIMAGVKIKNARIGDNFVACENAVIGAYGFTMAGDELGNKFRIPTLGKVIIGNNVEIGALNNVSVGGGGDTVIEDYVKLDALVHVGHNDKLCKNVEVPAGVIFSGFVTAEEHAYIGVNASIRNRITLGENCVIGMGAVVTKSVLPGTTVAGNPAKLFVKKDK